MPEKVCALSGHRILGKEYDKAAVQKILLELISEGYDTFLCGMALGFDLNCIEFLASIKDEYALKLSAYVPCADQSGKFSPLQRARYDSLLEKCDEKIVFFDSYVNGCMQVRNRRLIEDSDVLLAYLKRQSGGTFYTVNYAKRLGKRIIFV